MLVYLITYILTPRSSNHAQVLDDDLQIVYGMKSGIKMNWVLQIEDILLKCRRLVDYEFPYAVLASNLLTTLRLMSLMRLWILPKPLVR